MSWDIDTIKFKLGDWVTSQRSCYGKPGKITRIYKRRNESSYYLKLEFEHNGNIKSINVPSYTCKLSTAETRHEKICKLGI